MQDLIRVAYYCQIAQIFAILGCTLAKTSFAITLMRIAPQRWVHAILWFIIVTMNLANVLCTIFVFAQCKDPRHTWNVRIPSECWPDYVFTNYSLFVSGKFAELKFVSVSISCGLTYYPQVTRVRRISFLPSFRGPFCGS
jgi:hypothetical protein